MSFVQLIQVQKALNDQVSLKPDVFPHLCVLGVLKTSSFRSSKVKPRDSTVKPKGR